MKVIIKKIAPMYFNEVDLNNKREESRFDDFDGKVGDLLILREFEAIEMMYSGRVLFKEISYINSFGMLEGFKSYSMKTPNCFNELKVQIIETYKSTDCIDDFLVEMQRIGVEVVI